MKLQSIKINRMLQVVIIELLCLSLPKWALTQSVTQPSITQGLSVQSGTKWLNATCQVCWENPTAGTTAQLNGVRQAVARTWEAESGFRFTGWGTCKATSKGIRIRIADDVPHVKELGSLLDGVIDGMVLNFTFQIKSEYCSGTTTAAKQRCIEKTAVHEFGHALGIAHEHNRSDCPPCDDEPQGRTGDWNITPCDLSSVMNYCNPAWNNNGRLSDLDIEGIRVLYPAFLVQTGTALPETNQNFKFLVADWNSDNAPDLIAIKKAGTPTQKTEIHILSGLSGFKTFLLQTATGLAMTDETFDFQIGDWDRDGKIDLFAIKKSATGTNSTEVHILSGASNYKNFIFQSGTALAETDQKFVFQVADWNRDNKLDLIAIQKSSTGTNSTEVHILSGASNFGSFLLQTGSALQETGANFDFMVTNWNQDNVPDLVAIKKSLTPTNKTEVHVLSGAGNFQNFLLHTATALHQTNDSWAFAISDFNRDGKKELFSIARNNTGTSTTEVHILLVR